MRVGIAFALTVMLCLPGLVLALRVDIFREGRTAFSDLSGADSWDTVNLSLPANCHVLSASFNVSGHASAAEASAFPEGVSVRLGDLPLWEWSGEGYGPLGRQDRFLDNEKSSATAIPPGGGTDGMSFHLPRTATVQSATVEVNCSGSEKLLRLGSLLGAGTSGAQFGSSVADAGDLNGDGYDDLIIGAPFDDSGGLDTGSAFVFFGGPQPDSTPDLVLKGAAFYDIFGCSVAGAGDLNGDGYDDLIVGAAWNDSAFYVAGRAYIFFGGSPMDDLADVFIDGGGQFEFLGSSVAGAGDLNGDGYDDVVIGAPGYPAYRVETGRAVVCFGGPTMDGIPDINITGAMYGDRFGGSVAGADDVNRDGYDDFLVGAPGNDAGGIDAGRAYLFLGGPTVDPYADLTPTSNYNNESYGQSVAGAGDVNGDGYADFLVGGPLFGAGTEGTGAAYLYLGGATIDDTPDVTFLGSVWRGMLGSSVSSAGDVNADGFSDVVVGASNDSSAATGAGAVFVFLGGRSMDALADITVNGPASGDSLGRSVSGGGDINGDGYCDFIAGAHLSDYGAVDAGRALVYSRAPFILDPALNLGGATLWSHAGYFAGRVRIPDFSPELRSFLRDNPSSGSDYFGNPRIEVPLGVSALEGGQMSMANLTVTYDYSGRTPDFSEPLNAYISGHRAEADASGNITVPLNVSSRSPGRVKLWDPEIVLDGPPSPIRPLPRLAMDEDTVRTLADLRDYFQDEYDRPDELNFSIMSASGADRVALCITGGHYLVADASTGAANDNWTGELWALLRCTDRWGLSVDSNLFQIVVRDQNDAPEFTSVPLTYATVGLEYEYRLAAVDGDDDAIQFGAVGAPSGMSLDPGTGVFRWLPGAAGIYSVSAFVTDGTLRTYQNFTVEVSALNKAPRFASTPPTTATAAVRYVYAARAVDVDGDRLNYTLELWPGGMTLDRATGAIAWTPSKALSGDFNVSIRVSDGKGGEASQNFTITVQPFRDPKIVFAQPTAGGAVSGNYLFSGRVERGTLDILGVQLRIDSGEWLNATGNGTWGLKVNTRSLGDGEHRLEVRTLDPTGYSDPVALSFRVENELTSGTDWLPVAGVLASVALAAVAVILWWRSRRPKFYDWG